MKSLLTGRWVAFSIVCIVAFAVLLGLAQWQWAAAQSHNRGPSTKISPVDTIVTLDGGVPGNAVGSLVSASGTYVATTQVRIAGQHVGGRSVDWVVTALRESSGILVAVARGYVEAGAPLPTPPTGTVVVVSALQAADNSGAGNSPMTSVSTLALTSQWRQRMRDGYIVVKHSQPAQSGVATIPSSAIHVHRGLPVWRNVAYAIQWLMFAGFVVFFWFRVSRDQVRSEPSTSPDSPMQQDEVSTVVETSQQGES